MSYENETALVEECNRRQEALTKLKKALAKLPRYSLRIVYSDRRHDIDLLRDDQLGKVVMVEDVINLMEKNYDD